MDRQAIEKRVRRACKSLVQRDRLLLKLDVNERSITHKLAEYLRVEFPRWHVDCEYNRIGSEPIEPKRLQLAVNQISSDDDQGKTVYPDVIVHRRSNTQRNLLVIEVKKSTNPEPRNHDKRKLKAYTSQLGYRYAVSLEIQTRVQHPKILFRFM